MFVLFMFATVSTQTTARFTNSSKFADRTPDRGRGGGPVRIFPQFKKNLKSRSTEMQFPAFLASKRTLLAAKLRAADIWLLP